MIQNRPQRLWFPLESFPKTIISCRFGYIFKAQYDIVLRFFYKCVGPMKELMSLRNMIIISKTDNWRKP